jgi:site-specific recombinase XerD
MNLNNTFSHQRFEEYAQYLKNTGLADTSLKRKLSSLSSFRHFLYRKKMISVSDSSKDQSIISTIRNIFPFKKNN